MNLTDFENIRFNKGLRGYDVQEVNYFINELLKLCHKLEAENKTLKEKVATYEQQEQFIRAALVTAEQTAESIKMNAKDIAKDIQTEAEKNALKLIKKTENETKAYRDNIYKCFYSYERELRLIVDHFYTLARKHMQQLEKELAEQIQAAISKFDTEYNTVPRLNRPSKSTENSHTKNTEISNKFEEKEHALLLGRILQQDIVNADGCIIAEKNTVITPELIKSLITKGLYGELIIAAEKKEG